MLYLAYVLYLSCIINFTGAASLTPNYKSSCVLLNTRIYCFSGGYAALGDYVVKRALDEHHYLDLTQELILDETSAKWISIPDDTNYLVEPAMAATASFVTNNSYIVDGGYNETPDVKNTTRLFNTLTNSWSTISNENGIQNAIYMNTAVEVLSQKKIYYWGGLSGQYPGFPVNTTTVLSVEPQNRSFSWSICPGVLPLNAVTRFGHSATLDGDGIFIYYLGGRIRTSSTNDDSSNDRKWPRVPYDSISMSRILTYNTMDASWTLKQSPSRVNITSRYMHTASLLPSNQILIYGGATDDGNEKRPSAVLDYLYLFDPKTLEFTRMEEFEQTQGAGPRFGHSALLYKNTLFILFGVNQKGLITNDVYFLNTTDSTWLKSFSTSGNVVTGNNSGGNYNLSTQAIIGITIGSVLVALFLLIGLLYFLYGGKKHSSEAEEDLPKLYKEYTNPNEYEQDAATLHDYQTPPRGYSILHKPNQVKDQQPLSFIEGQQQQSSTGSFYLQPTTPTAMMSTTSSTILNSLVKPSI